MRWPARKTCPWEPWAQRRAAAARLARRPGAKLIGDGLVPVSSALGEHAHGGERSLAFPAEHQLLVERAGHLDLLDHPEVSAALCRWLG